MENKTLGQIAFETYSNKALGKTYDDKPIPTWGKLTKGQEARDIWEAVAKAVENEVLPHDARMALLYALESLREFKPNDRSETDRRYAVTITMMEQTYAYFATWVLSAGRE
jgi:hypothetical protein